MLACLPTAGVKIRALMPTNVIVQIFGTKKCKETRKAERWFKERGIRVQNVELTEKGLRLVS